MRKRVKIDFDGGCYVEGGFTVIKWDSRHTFNDVEPSTEEEVMLFTHKSSNDFAVNHVSRILDELSYESRWNDDEFDLLMSAVNKYMDAH